MISYNWKLNDWMPFIIFHNFFKNLILKKKTLEILQWNHFFQLSFFSNQKVTSWYIHNKIISLRISYVNKTPLGRIRHLLLKKWKKNKWHWRTKNVYFKRGTVDSVMNVFMLKQGHVFFHNKFTITLKMLSTLKTHELILKSLIVHLLSNFVCLILPIVIFGESKDQKVT